MALSRNQSSKRQISKGTNHLRRQEIWFSSGCGSFCHWKGAQTKHGRGQSRKWRKHTHYAAHPIVTQESSTQHISESDRNGSCDARRNTLLKIRDPCVVCCP